MQRQVKSDAEKKVLRQAAKIADKGIQAAFERQNPGARELDIALTAAEVCYEEGVDSVARTRIYGKNISGVRWPILSNRKLDSRRNYRNRPCRIVSKLRL